MPQTLLGNLTVLPQTLNLWVVLCPRGKEGKEKKSKGLGGPGNERGWKTWGFSRPAAPQLLHQKCTHECHHSSFHTAAHEPCKN